MKTNEPIKTVIEQWSGNNLIRVWDTSSVDTVLSELGITSDNIRATFTGFEWLWYEFIYGVIGYD